MADTDLKQQGCCAIPMKGDVKLTEFTSAGGWGAKLGPEVLADIVAGITKIPDPNLLLGFDSSDDAAVIKVTDELCVIHTVDFFPPIVDDAYDFGAIAASNALSDVYAMNGRPISALNILAIPANFDHSVVTKAILEGGSDKAAEAGINISGGHSLEDKEPKYGLSVVGIAKIKDILTNSGARAGDMLVMTKPIGSGILTTADKASMLSTAEHKKLVAHLKELNRWPAEQLAGLDVSACTDITGFGLIGHAGEMADGSDKTIYLYANKLPLMDQVVDLARDGIIPKGAYNNRNFMQGRYQADDNVPLPIEDAAFDPQTSGGLFYAMSEISSQEFIRRCHRKGLQAWLVGQVKEREGDISVKLLFA